MGPQDVWKAFKMLDLKYILHQSANKIVPIIIFIIRNVQPYSGTEQSVIMQLSVACQLETQIKSPNAHTQQVGTGSNVFIYAIKSAVLLIWIFHIKSVNSHKLPKTFYIIIKKYINYCKIYL